MSSTSASSVILHLERLRRHYEGAVRTYDVVSLLDLAHALRIWTELKTVLPKHWPSLGTTTSFKTGIPAKKLLKAVRGAKYVFCYVPGGVVTYASNGHLASGPEMQDGAGDFTVGVKVKQDGQGPIWLRQFCLIDTVLNEQLRHAMSHETTTRCNFANWLGSEVVRLRYKTKSGEVRAVAISREMIVKRVANTLDASHASLAGGDTDNTFDEPVHYLLQYQVGGLPLPYFILLKIAQDILAVSPKLLGLDWPSLIPE